MIKINHSVEIDNLDQYELRQTEPYIIFTINSEEFGIEAANVLEMIKYMPPLLMPNNFINVCGMSVFRGKILPIIDLRRIFGLEGIAYDNKTVTIMVKSAVSNFGIIAERVLDINYIPVTSIKTVTALNLGAKTKYLKSVANIEGRLILLLDPEKMIESKQDRSVLKEPVPGEEPIGFNNPSSYLKAEANPENNLGNAEIPVAYLKTVDFQDLQPSEAGLELKNEPIEPSEEIAIPITQLEKSTPRSVEPSSYLIDPKELEDLLKQAEVKPEQKEELDFELTPDTAGSSEPIETGSRPSDLMEPRRIEAILSELERENQGENEGQSLSAETIEDILKELEDEIRPETDYSPNNEYRVLGTNNTETPEDKSDD